MNKTARILLSLILLVSLALGGCGNSPASLPEQETDGDECSASPVIRDFVSELKLDMTSSTLKREVTVQNFVDGDTTHFSFTAPNGSTEIIKARYLAVDTPESTGKIEEYGKAASVFTRGRLESASSIIVESDSSEWNTDSTGSRCLLWVWYRNNEEEDYRNLNLEILQNGYALASSTANNRYGKICMAALEQAKSQKLNLYSGEPDPYFFYGDAIELSLRELRLNPKKYEGCKVAFSGVVTRYSGNGVFVQDYDAETDLYYGIYVYYGFNLSGKGLSFLSVGNEVRIVGTLSYYENSGSYQISGLSYNPMKPDDPGNLQKLSENCEVVFSKISAEDFAEGCISAEADGESKTFDLSLLLQDTAVEIKSLYVESANTTTDPNSSTNGAMTLFCTSGETGITLRTAVLHDENNEIIGEDYFVGKTVNVKGIVSRYGGEAQILVLSLNDIEIT